MKYLLLILLLIPNLCMAQGTLTTTAEPDKGALTTGGSGVMTTVAGGKSMLFTHDAADHAAGYVYKTLGSNQSEVYTEFWVRVNETDTWGASAQRFYLFSGRTSADGSNISIDLRSNAGGTDITVLNLVWYNDSAAATDSNTTVNVNPNTWHKIKLRWKAATGAGNNDGIITMYFDDMETPVYSVTNADTDTKNIKTLRFGGILNSTANSTTLLINLDDFKAGTSDGGTDLMSDTWNSSATAETNWTGLTDAGSALSVDATVYH